MTTTTSQPANTQGLQRPPANPQPVGPRHQVTGPGKAEIKKHNDDGILRGLRQLGAGPGRRPPRGWVQRHVSSGQDRYLITYRPTPSIVNGVQRVDVYAVRFPAGTVVPASVPDVLAMQWISLGPVGVRLPVPAPSDAQFGRAAEGPVRRHFINTMVPPRRRGLRGWAHDVVWDELADFYRELAEELGASGGSFRF